MKKEPSNEEYNAYVKQVTPKHNCVLNCLRAFLIGGIICTVGEVISQVLQNQWGLNMDDTGSYVSMILVALSVILTGFNLYGPLAKFGGAGALVPITGFANSVASPCIEYQKEGQVFGIGVKVFTIAGPVILYGIFTSFVLGLIYWILKALEIL
ncbi:MAG: stage V sporulation protein AC [Lachnospiraceae bacterium]|nr:stage V sporulation protein AC [Lachnospiraceae bacterium]